MQSGPGVGTFTTEAAPDQEPQVVSYRRLDEPALLLTVGLSLDDILARFRLNRTIALVAGAAISAGICAVGLVMMRQRQRLVRSNTLLSVTLENMTQGIQTIEPDGRVGVINSRAIELLGIPVSLLEKKVRFPEIVQWQLENGEFGDPTHYPEGLRNALAAGGIAPAMDTYVRRRPNGRVLEITTKPMADVARCAPTPTSRTGPTPPRNWPPRGTPPRPADVPAWSSWR